INFHYSIVEKGNPEPVVNSEFTIAVPYITTEYYEGDSTTKDPTSTDDPTTPSNPAFSFLATALALTIAARRS
ncbi:MAG: sarcinarray family protein, partial [Methanosarcinaceae archaeon]|nr:sarcinarray family protein [Methanosarcinaceae archaeon]